MAPIIAWLLHLTCSLSLLSRGVEAVPVSEPMKAPSDLHCVGGFIKFCALAYAESPAAIPHVLNWARKCDVWSRINRCKKQRDDPRSPPPFDNSDIAATTKRFAEDESESMILDKRLFGIEFSRLDLKKANDWLCGKYYEPLSDWNSRTPNEVDDEYYTKKHNSIDAGWEWVNKLAEDGVFDGDMLESLDKREEHVTGSLPYEIVGNHRKMLLRREGSKGYTTYKINGNHTGQDRGGDATSFAMVKNVANYTRAELGNEPSIPSVTVKSKTVTRREA